MHVGRCVRGCEGGCVYVLGGVCMCVGVWMASHLELLEYEKIMLIKVA